jgi:hypothetical protein
MSRGLQPPTSAASRRRGRVHCAPLVAPPVRAVIMASRAVSADPRRASIQRSASAARPRPRKSWAGSLRLMALPGVGQWAVSLRGNRLGRDWPQWALADPQGGTGRRANGLGRFWPPARRSFHMPKGPDRPWRRKARKMPQERVRGRAGRGGGGRRLQGAPGALQEPWRGFPKPGVGQATLWPGPASLTGRRDVGAAAAAAVLALGLPADWRERTLGALERRQQMRPHQSAVERSCPRDRLRVSSVRGRGPRHGRPPGLPGRSKYYSPTNMPDTSDRYVLDLA